MINRLLLTIPLNLVFAWFLYQLGWQYFDNVPFLLLLPLVLLISLTVSAGHWAIWNQGSYSKTRITLNVGFNLFFASVCYFAGWYDLRWTILLAFVMAIPLMGGMNFMWVSQSERHADSGEVEKRKRERLDTVLRDLSDDDLLRLKERLTNGTINDDILEGQLVGEDGELLRERR